MTSAQLKITCAVHTFEVGETAMFNDLESFIERMKETCTDGFHLVRIDRHEWRRLSRLWPCADQEPRFDHGGSFRLPGGKSAHFIIEAI